MKHAPFALAVLASLAAPLACARGAECASLTDCPGSLVCSRDGACVENENPGALRLANGGVYGALGRELASPEQQARMRGRIALRDVDADASVDFEGDSLYVETSAEELVIVSEAAPGALAEALTTPGTRTYGATLDDEVYGATCSPDYDEPATEIVVEVNEPDVDGVTTVRVTERNENSDVTVTLDLAPL